MTDPVRSPSTEPAPKPESDDSIGWECEQGRHMNCHGQGCDCSCHTVGAVPVSVPPGEAEKPMTLAEHLADELDDWQCVSCVEGESTCPDCDVDYDYCEHDCPDCQKLRDACALLRSQARESSDWEKIARDHFTDVQALRDEVAELSRELEEAKRPIPREGERIVLAWLDAMHAKYPASEYGMAAVLVRSLSRQLEEAKEYEARAMVEYGKLLMYPHPRELMAQLEEARTENERLRRHLQWAKSPHHANCRCSTLSDTGNCSCGLSGLLEVSGE